MVWRAQKNLQNINDAGAEALLGNLEDLEVLKQGTSLADGVIHTAFIHDFTQYLKAGDIDRVAINAIGEELEGTTKPFIVTSGMLGLPNINGYITEESSAESAPRT